MKNPEILRIGTRASKLAIAQSEEVKRRLMAAYPDMPASHFVIVPMTTTGDTVQDRALNEIGGKGLFTKEIEEALLTDTVDIAVHSMKDMPTILPDGLAITTLLEREDPRDAFISFTSENIATLPYGARLGTASLRRGAQLKRHRPDLQVVNLRGNVNTRLRKLGEGECDATLLAVAGLKRLGMENVITCPLPASVCLPAIAQGAIGIECRKEDIVLIEWLSAIHHHDTDLCITAERSLLAALDGSCRTPIAGLAELHNGQLTLEGLVARPDGSTHYRRKITVPATLDAAYTAGQELGNTLLELAGPGFLAGH